MRIGVQLPDGLKKRAIEICEKLGDVILSGESCFGACDIDFDLLEDVDILYHYAHTSILKIEKVVYVPYFLDYDVKKICESLKKLKEKRIALISTAQYCHKLPEIKENLEKFGFNVELKKGKRSEYLGLVVGCDYSVIKDSKAEAIVFIGDGIFHAKGAVIYSGRRVYALNPFNFELIEVKVEDFIRERYIQISRCVGLKNLGILVSTKPGQKRLKIAEEIKRKAKEYGLRAIVVYISEITPEKLENLPFDFYVNTACPRVSYDDYIRFKRPIITPQEFDFLLGLKNYLEIDEIQIE
ncbi:MAG: diphthamide biosynthesis enzyme Dph2 [Archaeoglobaceae archaeon]|nr:diphthamide biosynthesis enzyme Dph2 [Archaeoglobaceae archaeon]MDW7989096.1 diphthamide biosynthesis enzyme Dph2 [Archaeoglobaceae archaeon]